MRYRPMYLIGYAERRMAAPVESGIAQGTQYHRIFKSVLAGDIDQVRNKLSNEIHGPDRGIDDKSLPHTTGILIQL